MRGLLRDIPLTRPHCVRAPSPARGEGRTAPAPSTNSARLSIRHHATFSRRQTPELCKIIGPSQIRGRRECRALCRTRSLACQKKKTYELKSPQVRQRRSGIPRANGFNGFLRALPGEPGFLVTIACESSSRGLDISVGISGPHDFAVRLRSAFVCRATSVHRIPRATFSDDRETPLFSGTGRAKKCQ